MVEPWSSPAFKDLGDNEEPAKDIKKYSICRVIHTHKHTQSLFLRNLS